jgi:hypothetical protein
LTVPVRTKPEAKQQQTNKTMSIFLLILIAVPLLFYGLIKHLENRALSKIIDTTTGKPISRDRVIGIIPSLMSMIGDKKTHRAIKHLRDSQRFNFKPYVTFLGYKPIVNSIPMSDVHRVFFNYVDFPKMTAFNAFLR